ncbi:MAG TPA: hypothetical protein VMW27_05335 [Thermoanaerobaculia bacterium]|nr:hypothetical protein [Thermoanaerobaculia bacterium]
MTVASVDTGWVVPYGSLPEDPEERFLFLSSCFERQVVEATPHDRGWLLELRWPGSAASYVDPRLEEGLRWFSEHLLVSDIHLGVRLEEGFQLALDDGWTLLSWSSWLQERPAPQGLSVLHLDSHADLMSPRLSRAGGGWTDLMTGEAVDLRDPLSVVAALRSNAIGIGSFIVPFVHDVPGLDLFHLCARGRMTAAPGVYAVEPVLDEDDRLFPGARRPRAALRRASDTELRRSPAGRSRYHLSDDLGELLAAIPPGPVLLHVDMDYFNDRYDGRPDWQETVRHDPAPDDVLASIDQVFHALAASPVGERIEDVTVALSPGFFPAELWEAAIDRVRHGVRRLGGGV